MKPGRSVETMTCLPRARGQGPDGVDRLVARVAAADELDERHDRHGAEEMHPDEPLATRSADRLGQPVDGDRRGVRGEDRVRRGQPVELAPERRLDRDVLEHGLDDEVGAGDARRCRR